MLDPRSHPARRLASISSSVSAGGRHTGTAAHDRLSTPPMVGTAIGGRILVIDSVREPACATVRAGVLALMGFASLSTAAALPALIPRPTNVERHTGYFTLTTQTRIETPVQFQRAGELMAGWLAADTGLRLAGVYCQAPAHKCKWFSVKGLPARVCITHAGYYGVRPTRVNPRDFVAAGFVWKAQWRCVADPSLPARGTAVRIAGFG